MALTKEVKQELIGQHGRNEHGHGLARGADRDADEADQRPHGASPHASEGSLLAPRPAEAGRPPTPVPDVPAEARSRGLSRPHQGARPAGASRQPGSHPGGWKLGRAPARELPELTQTSTLRKQSGGQRGMSIATGQLASVSAEIGGRDITFETGKLAKQADGAVLVEVRRDDDSRHGAGPPGGPRGRRLLPADDRRGREDVRRRQDPRRLFQARGPRDRARHPDRAHDRPPDPAALAEGLPQRGAGHLHDAVGRHGHAARHPVHQRRVGGAAHLAAAVLRAGRRRPHRPHRG